MVKSQRAFTLIEVMIAIMIGAVVLGGVATVMVQLGQNQSDAQLQMTIDSIQSTGVQYLRIMKNIRGITHTDSTVAGFSAAFYACLEDKGTNCNTVGSPAPLAYTNIAAIPGAPQPPLNNFIGPNKGSAAASCPSASTACPIQTITQYKATCTSATRCENITIQMQINMATAGLKTKFASRSYTFVVPGYTIVSRGEVDFSCTSLIPLITSIDFTGTLKAVCTAMSGFNGSPNPTLVPIGNYGDAGPDYQALANDTCSDGFFTLGLETGQQSCNTNSGLPPSAGSCGPATTILTTTAPSSGLCDMGTPSIPVITGPAYEDVWQWTCTSPGGTATCNSKSPCAPPYDGGIFGTSTYGCSEWDP